MTVSEAAKQLEVSISTLRRMIDLGLIGYTRVGVGRGAIRLSDADIAEYRSRQHVEPVESRLVTSSSAPSRVPSLPSLRQPTGELARYRQAREERRRARELAARHRVGERSPD